MNGLARCLRYAFGPNRFHLCGPTVNQELLNYLSEQNPDRGLVSLLKKFKTMYSYLKKIAEINKINNPFDDKVVEAYWIGNDLLENIPRKEFCRHLKWEQQKKKVDLQRFKAIPGKLNQGAKMHHSFHVFNVWKSGNRRRDKQTIEQMDKCRVSWGRVSLIDGPLLYVKTKPLFLNKKDKLTPGPEIKKRIMRRLSDDCSLDEVKVGDIISIHWDIPCEILTKKQLANLKKYTKLSLRLANQTK